MRVVLASTSPRRRELLFLLGIPFEVRSPSCEERIIPGFGARELAAKFSCEKARSISTDDSDAIVLGSDTLIELGGTVLGKPSDLSEARTMLRQMAGREHMVHTAVTLSCRDHAIETTQCSTAHVRMKPFDAEAHARYLASGDSQGKAGAYSIQGPGADLIEALKGDFTTVVGLPLMLTASLLEEAGVHIPIDIHALYAEKPFGTWMRFPG